MGSASPRKRRILEGGTALSSSEVFFTSASCAGELSSCQRPRFSVKLVKLLFRFLNNLALPAFDASVGRTDGTKGR